MTKSDGMADVSIDDLVANLGAIASPADIELINKYLKLGIGQTAKDSDARNKANQRTQHYKLRKLLLREPSSQQILQACAYAAFARYSTETPSSKPIVQEVQELLVAAGFDKHRTVAAMARLVSDADVRKIAWVARTRSGMQLAIVKAIRTIKANDRSKAVTK
jgi:hypothetical protein